MEGFIRFLRRGRAGMPASRRKNTACSLKLLDETRADGATARRLAIVYRTFVFSPVFDTRKRRNDKQAAVLQVLRLLSPRYGIVDRNAMLSVLLQAADTSRLESGSKEQNSYASYSAKERKA